MIDDVGPAFNDSAFESNQVSYADMTALNTMARPRLDVTARRDGAGVDIALHNPSTDIAFFQRVELLADQDGDEILPIEYDDNYVTVFPGETTHIRGRVPGSGPEPNWYASPATPAPRRPFRWADTRPRRTCAPSGCLTVNMARRPRIRRGTHLARARPGGGRCSGQCGVHRHRNRGAPAGDHGRSRGPGVSTVMVITPLRRPLWWAGTGAAITGFVFQAIALAFGSLLLAAPLLVSALLFASAAQVPDWPTAGSPGWEWAWAPLLTVALGCSSPWPGPRRGLPGFGKTRR